MKGTGRRSAGPAGLLAVVALTFLLASPAGAPAHAIVLESTPVHDARLDRSPPRVVLRFNSAIEHALTRVTLIAGDGRPVPLAAAAGGPGRGAAPDRLVVPLRPLPPGTYVIRYRVLATDGHLTEGALRFSVRAAP